MLVLLQTKVPAQALVAQAHKDFEAGRYSEAAPKLKRALKTDAQNPVLWFYLGVSEMKLDEVDPAIEALEKSVALAPKEVPAYFNLGILYWRTGDVGKAIKAYREGLGLKPDDLDANQNYALLLMKTGRYQEAIAPLQRLKGLERSNLPVRVGLIESYIKAGQKSSGEAEVHELLTSRLASPEDEVKLGAVLLQDGAPGLAIPVLRDATSAAPGLADAHGGLGLILLSDGQYKDAVHELGRAAQIDPGSAKYALGLAEALHRWNHNTTLLSYLEAVKPRFGNLPQFQYLLGLAHYNLSHYPKAVDIFNQLLTINPPRRDLILYYLGNSYLAMMEFPKAESCYQQAIELNPNDSTYYDAYAELLRKKGPSHIGQAVALLEKAMALDPKDTRASLELGLSYEAQQQLPQAQSLLEDCVRLQPDLLPARVALARIYFRQGKREQGEKEKAIIIRLEAEQQKKQLQLGAEHRGSAARETSRSGRPQ